MVNRRDVVTTGVVAGAAMTATVGSQQTAQADTIFTTFAYPVGVSTATRTTPARFSDVLNVKDFGAMGDGTTDDTVAIQKCFNAAFGSSSSPHNGLSSAGSPMYSNKPVFFPAGSYKTTAPLTLTGVVGGMISGAGRVDTGIQIQNGLASSQPCIITNGCAYTTFARLNISIPGNGSTAEAAVMELDWDGNNSSLGVSLQGNSFYDVSFGSGGIGCRIGNSGFGGNSHIFVNCGWFTNGIAGLIAANPNAYSISLFGCQPQGCGIGVWCPSGGGAVETMHGISVQGSCLYDIVLESTVGAYSICGARSESVSFLKVNGPVPVRVAGCGHLTGSSKAVSINIASSLASVSADNCTLGGCIIGSGNALVRGNGSNFGNIFSGSTVGTFTGHVSEFVSQGNTNPWTVALLPPAANSMGLRTYISDSSFSVNSSSYFGTVIGTGGGSSVYVPVWSDGTNWRIG